MIDALPPVLVWSVGLGVLGAIVGSFIAALVVRWPQGRSVMRGRSQCDACGHVLRAIDLVPLLSAVALRGRCRDCAVPIDPTHWQIELVALGIGVAAGLVAPGPVALAGAVFGWLLLALAALDLAALWLPLRLTGLLVGAGLVAASLGVGPGIEDALIGGVAAFTALSLIAFGYKSMRGHEGMGGGDPLLFGAIGLWLGWRMLPAVLLIASVIGLCVALVAHLRRRDVRWTTKMPFGALLAIAAYPAWLAMIGFAA